jgi:hypothetical protein
MDPNDVSPFFNEGGDWNVDSTDHGNATAQQVSGAAALARIRSGTPPGNPSQGLEGRPSGTDP